MDDIYLTALVKWKAMINLEVFRCYDFHSGKWDCVWFKDHVKTFYSSYSLDSPTTGGSVTAGDKEKISLLLLSVKSS